MRRQALRLAGGVLAGALLTAVGLTNLAGAPEPAILARCEHVEGNRIEPLEPGELLVMARPGPACPEGTACGVLLNPGDRLQCRCISRS